MRLIFLLLFTFHNAWTEENLDTLFLKNDLSDISQNLKKASQTIDAWAQTVQQNNFDFICLGESHSEVYRNIYGDILARIQFDRLFIEASNDELSEIQENYKKQLPTLLLNAPFDPILNAIKKSSPSSDIIAVESTKEQDALQTKQAIETGQSHLSRDGFIAANIIRNSQEQKRAIALYGRTHCSLNNNGLGSVPFFNFLSQYWTHKKIFNVMVLLRNSGNTVHPLVSFLDMGVDSNTKSIVVIDGQKLTPKDYNYNWEIRTLFDNFRYVIVY